MLDAEREAAWTLAAAPWLPVAALPVAVAWLVAQALAAVPVVVFTLPRNTAMVFALPLAGALSVLLLPPTLAGLYPTVRRARDREGHIGLRATVGLYVGGCVTHARDLTVATVVYRVAALVPAAVALVALLVGDTAVTSVRYGTGTVGSVYGLQELVVAWVGVTLAGGVGRLVLVFYDLPVLFAGVAPRQCWRVAARVARRRPRALLRYGGVRLVLWAPMGVVVAFEAQVLTGDPWTRELLALTAGALVCGATTTAAIAAHHVVTYERTVEPALREPTPTGTQGDAGPESALVASPGEGDDDRTGTTTTRRAATAWALAALLVVAAAAGAGAVRVTDERPMPTTGGPVPADATGEVVVGDAYRHLETASYRSEMRLHRTNGTTGERFLVWAVDVAVDRRARKLRFSSRLRDGPGDDWMQTRFYVTETTTAVWGYGDPDSEVPVRSRLVVSQSGNWTVLAVPGYETMAGDVVDTPEFDDERHDPAVVERTDDRVVVASTWRRDGDPHEDGTTLSVERVRMVVDADTGRPVEVVTNRTFSEYENGTAVAREYSTERYTFTDYGDVTVQRPDALGPRGPVEWLWDLVYY